MITFLASVGTKESPAIFEQFTLYSYTIWQALMPLTRENFACGYEHFRLFDRDSLRAVCCKDQLRSSNIEKTGFPKVSGRLDFYLFFWIFFCILRSKQLKLTAKSRIFRMLPFKKCKRCRKDQPRKSKDLISTAYWRCKIWMRIQRKFLTNFIKFMLRDRAHQHWI